MTRNIITLSLLGNLVFLTVLLIVNSKNIPSENDNDKVRPFIGILVVETHMNTPDGPSFKSYVPASYVKWAESLGARVTPIIYGRWVTRRVAVATIATIWLLAALISFVPISLGLHRPPQPLVYHDEHGKHYPTCALDLTPSYAVISSCISFYVPCIVMIGIYCRLYCYAQKHVKSIRAVTRPIDIPNDTETPKRHKSIKANNKTLHIHMHNHQSSPYHVSDHKAAITVGVIMGVFLICWVPFFCINIVAAFCKTCIPDITFKILTWLGYSNSAFNPIIYSIFNTEFREAFKRILTTHYPDWCRCGYQAVNRSSIDTIKNDRFVTDYGTKTMIVSTKRKGSFHEFSSDRNLSPRSSIDSVRQTRINSTDMIGNQISAI